MRCMSSIDWAMAFPGNVAAQVEIREAAQKPPSPHIALSSHSVFSVAQENAFYLKGECSARGPGLLMGLELKFSAFVIIEFVALFHSRFVRTSAVYNQTTAITTAGKSSWACLKLGLGQRQRDRHRRAR